MVGMECLTRDVCPMRPLLGEKMSLNPVRRFTSSVLSEDDRFGKSKWSNEDTWEVLSGSSLDTKRMFCSGITKPNFIPLNRDGLIFSDLVVMNTTQGASNTQVARKVQYWFYIHH